MAFPQTLCISLGTKIVQEWYKQQYRENICNVQYISHT